MRAPVRVWPDPPDFQNHPCNLLHGWMDGGRKGGMENIPQEKLITEQKVLGLRHTHTQHRCFFLSHRQTLTQHCCYTYSVKDGLSLSSATFTTIKITTVWLDNNPNAVTSTVVKRWNTTGYFRKAKDSLFFGKLDSKGYWTGIYCILRTHTRTQASKIKAHICPCMLELSSKSNLTLSFYCRDVLRRKHFLEAFSVSTSCIKETKRWWRINNKWDTVTLLENLHLGCIHHRPDVISEVTGCF